MNYLKEPLSVCLAEWLGDANAPQVRAGWSGRAAALEANVERLRGELGKELRALDAYRAAVAELRQLASAADYEVEPLQLHMAEVLDKLPKDAP